MIILAVKIKCKAEKVSTASEFFRSFVPRAQSENGCVQYELFTSESDPCLFYFFEKWADRASYEAHSRQPYLLEFRDRYAELLAQPNEVLFLKLPQL